MRVPRVRFTVRRMTVVVMLLAVSIGGVQTWTRWVRFRDLATLYAAHEQRVREAVANGEANITQARDRLSELRRTGPVGEYNVNGRDVSFAEFVASRERAIARRVEMHDRNRAWLVYFSQQKGKYERASRAPWNSVEPDPPPPEPDPPPGPLIELLPSSASSTQY